MWRLLVIVLLATVCAGTAFAQAQFTLPGGWDTSFCGATGLCTASPATGWDSLRAFLEDVVIPSVRQIFIGVAAFLFAWYALAMIYGGSEESTFTEQKKAFGYAAVGMGIAGGASFLVATFAPSFVGSSLVDPTPFTNGMNNTVDFLMIITGAFIIFVISVAGFRIIVLQGNEGEVEKQKKSFFHGLLGMVLLLVARVGVLAVLPTSVGGLGSPDSLIVEIAGMVKFLLEIAAGLAVIALIVGGFLFIVSVQSDERKQRGKRIVISTFIVLIIILLSHSLVATFIP